MKILISALLFVMSFVVLIVNTSCKGTQKKITKEKNSEEIITKVNESDSIIFSFVFFGCNRVDNSEQNNPSATDASTANLAVLKKIYNEISGIQRKPDLFFFLGDLVLGETNTTELDEQLEAWVKLMEDTSFSKISKADIELVAVPGNHEMLYKKTHKKIKDHDEWPLKGATEIWIKHLHPYLPEDRERITGSDSIIEQMTFSFIRQNVGFIVMNTDTYNEPTEIDPYGIEGIIPTGWIFKKIKEYRDNPEIEHIFILGHKPYYSYDKPSTGHDGLPEGPVLWPELNKFHVVAMLSAHVHNYLRMQPGDEGTYQIIAGNGGSQGPAEFFGYSIINIMSSGDVQLISKGFDKGEPYYTLPDDEPSTVRDETILTWTKNSNPYKYPKHK
ncbi:MAG: metallophosphoesterase [Ignavibacteria bacterium]